MLKCRIGLALCGSFCTFDRVFAAIEELTRLGADVTPILSYHSAQLDTRFGSAAQMREKLLTLCGHPIIDTIPAAEPIGPNHLFDVLLVAPCTGNTLAKLCAGITDTPVTMAVKSHMRNGRPVVIAVSTNDALGASAANIGTLLNRRYYYFVPMRQDDPVKKPRSVVADFTCIPACVEEALAGRQMQPLLLGAAGA